jgi:hypothetical protein
MSNLTPLLLYTGVGLLKNSGIGVNRDLSSAASTFNTSGISAVAQSAFAGADNTGKGLLRQIPSCLTGLPPAGVAMPAGATNNVVTDVIASANGLIANGVQGFASVLGQASSYAATTFGFQGALAQAQGMKFNDLGFTFNNYNDMASCGVTSQFSSKAVAGLISEMPRLGTLFKVKDLYNMSNPGYICANLIDLGLGYAGNLQNKLEDEGLDLTDLVNENQTVITGVMATIDDCDLTEIFSVTNFKPLGPVVNLAGVLEIKNVLGPDITSEIDSFDQLANKLGNIGGAFDSAKELAAFYSSLDIQNFPLLASIGTLLPYGAIEEVRSSLGEGSGPFGNPTALDIVGAASGVGYTENIQACVKTQNDLVTNTASVRQLMDYLEANNGSIDNATLAALVKNVNSDPGIQGILERGNDSMINLASKLATEKKNQTMAGVKLGNDMPTGSANGVLSLTTQIPGMAIDPMSLGLGTTLSNMATNDSYGEALRASIVESKNLSRFAVFGITPGQKMDPMAYAQQLGGMI